MSYLKINGIEYTPDVIKQVILVMDKTIEGASNKGFDTTALSLRIARNLVTHYYKEIIKEN
jgi:hypothetical protein